MSKILQTHETVHNTIGASLPKTYKLMDCGTFYMIKTIVDGESVVAHTGKAQHINKLWFALTKKRACLK